MKPKYCTVFKVHFFLKLMISSSEIIFLEKHNPKFLPVSPGSSVTGLAKEFHSLGFCFLFLWGCNPLRCRVVLRPCFFFLSFLLPHFSALVFLHNPPSCHLRLWNHSSWIIYLCQFFHEVESCFSAETFCDGKLLSFSHWWLCLEGLLRLAECCM